MSSSHKATRRTTSGRESLGLGLLREGDPRLLGLGPERDPSIEAGAVADVAAGVAGYLNAPAFHIVAPSLPGFGYSDKPATTGWGIEKIAAAWVELMGRLGYSKFAAHGGDWGGVITTVLAVGKLGVDEVEPVEGVILVLDPPEQVQVVDPAALDHRAAQHAFPREAVTHQHVRRREIEIEHAGLQPPDLQHYLAINVHGLEHYLEHPAVRLRLYNAVYATTAVTRAKYREVVDAYDPPPPAQCTICEEERQYVPPEGQSWTTLDALAQHAGWSAYHLHRVFKQVTGLTPKAYAAAHRARRVREALDRSDTVTQAIYGAGYNSNGRFYEESGAVLGMTPTAWRSKR